MKKESKSASQRHKLAVIPGFFPLLTNETTCNKINTCEKKQRTDKMNYRKPKRIFEDSGTVNPEEAYYVTLDNVTNRKNQDMKTMIDRGRYFSIFAPRQSGKTTFLKRLCDELHNNPVYIAIILSFQDNTDIAKTTFYELIEKKRGQSKKSQKP
jgi:predicted AAA+ superfamily ATPase